MTTCQNCQTTVRHSDTVGCCSQCGQCFSGLGAFDAHFGPRGRDGRCPCRDAATATRARKDGTTTPMFEASRKSRPGEPSVWAAWTSPEAREAFLDTFATGREAQEGPKSPEPVAVEPRTAPGGSPVTPQPAERA